MSSDRSRIIGAGKGSLPVSGPSTSTSDYSDESLQTRDDETINLLTQILNELKVLNFQMATITENNLDEIGRGE